MSDVSPLPGISRLSFDSTLLSPVLFSCLVLLPFLSFLFLPAGLSSQLFPENSSIFFVKRLAFLYCSCSAARRSKLVGGVCSMLPCGTGICYYAFFVVVVVVVLFLSIPFLYFFLNLVFINRRNGPQYQRVLALRAFLTGVILKGRILRKCCVRCLCMLCLCKFVSGLILWFMGNLWFDDLRAE